MVFCNIVKEIEREKRRLVTILILVDGFLQFKYDKTSFKKVTVTILILVDGFLQ